MSRYTFSRYLRHFAPALRILTALPPGRITQAFVVGMLIACWWPFHAPRNSISWGKDDRGVVFGKSGKFGELIGTQPLEILPTQATAITIELWLRPDGDAHNDRGTVVTFYSADGARQFKIDQYVTGVVLRWPDGTQFYAHGAMRRGLWSSVTITSDAAGTNVYANGRLIRSTPNLQVTNAILSQGVAFGTSAATASNWPGELRAFTIHNRVLARPTVWTNETQPDPEGLQVFYRFDKSGVIRNLAPAGDTLRIPDHYEVPAKEMLAPIDFCHPDDLMLNIIGFVPFGFFLCGFLQARGFRHVVLIVAIISAIFSLTIELVQISLPTRDSSMTDILTNIIGGTIGAGLRRWGDSTAFKWSSGAN